MNSNCEGMNTIAHNHLQSSLIPRFFFPHSLEKREKDLHHLQDLLSFHRKMIENNERMVNART